MKLLTRAFADWCHEHNLPLDRLTLVIRANDEVTLSRLESAYLQEFEGLTTLQQRLDRSVKQVKINGVRVSFSTLDRSRTQ